MSANGKLLHELRDMKNKLKKADLISYLSLAYWIYYREENENRLGLNLNLIWDMATDEGYRRIVSIYTNKEQVKKVGWQMIKGVVRVTIESLYSSFKGLEKQDLNEKSKEWFENYTDKLIDEISSLPHTSNTTQLDYARKSIFSFIDDYVRKAKKKNAYEELKILGKLIGDAISHDMAS